MSIGTRISNGQLLSPGYVPQTRRLKRLRTSLERRFAKARSRWEPKDDGYHLYGGSRTSAINVADEIAVVMDSWNCYTYFLRLFIWFGGADSMLQSAWHERACAEHWYAYEKDW